MQEPEGKLKLNGKRGENKVLPRIYRLNTALGTLLLFSCFTKKQSGFEDNLPKILIIFPQSSIYIVFITLVQCLD